MLSRGRVGRAREVILTFGQEFLSKSPPPNNMFCQSLPKKVTLIYIKQTMSFIQQTLHNAFMATPLTRT